MKSIPFLILLSLLISCGAKERPTEPQGPERPPEPVTGTPEGFHWTKNKKFLVKPSTTDLIPHEENTVTYRIVTSDLKPIDVRDYAFKIQSNMPTMPEMGGPWDALKIETTEGGEVAATYDIYHGHETHRWEFTIEISKDGNVEDTLVYSHLVKE